MPPRPVPFAYEHRQGPGFHRTAERSSVPVSRPLTGFPPWGDTGWETVAASGAIAGMTELPLEQGEFSHMAAYQIASTHSGWSMNGLRLCW